MPLARDDNLPATFVTPCLTLSLTSSKSGGWYVELTPVISSLPNNDIDLAPPNFLKASLFSVGFGTTFVNLLFLPCLLLEFSLRESQLSFSTSLFIFFAGFILSQSFLMTSIVDGIYDDFEFLIESSKSIKSLLDQFVLIFPLLYSSLNLNHDMLTSLMTSMSIKNQFLNCKFVSWSSLDFSVFTVFSGSLNFILSANSASFSISAKLAYLLLCAWRPPNKGIKLLLKLSLNELTLVVCCSKKSIGFTSIVSCALELYFCCASLDIQLCCLKKTHLNFRLIAFAAFVTMSNLYLIE
ncbi:hypothetical protein AGLY_014939 [Aphis glycines]|uniref:Uncharacterized protein n=1 Tax=Aphis glycines TaxID=307491 RepID=A0A6G0T2T1_APHGL|nr:hypothetical protein AGLY_014939 [Aphis glycines]